MEQCFEVLTLKKKARYKLTILHSINIAFKNKGKKKKTS